MGQASRRAPWIVLALGATGAACGSGAGTGAQTPVADASVDAGVSGSGLDAGTPLDASPMDAAADGAAPLDGTAQPPPGPPCGPTPTKIVDFHALAAQVDAAWVAAPEIVADTTNVYFFFNDTLMRAPVGGGPVVTMASLLTNPAMTVTQVDPTLISSSLVLHYPQSDHLHETIFAVPVDGGSPVALASSDGTISGFGTDQHAIYFIDQSGTKAVAGDGGAVSLLTDQLTSSATGSFGDPLAVDGARLVVTTEAQQGSVVALPIDGGSPTTLATSQKNASLPLPCGATICWWSGTMPDVPGGGTGPGAVEQLGDGGPSTVSPYAPYYPWSLLFDGTDFFETVGCDLCDGTLLRIPATGAAPVTMSASGAYAAIAGSCVYWSTLDGIYSAEKTYTPADAGVPDSASPDSGEAD
jgi:hypothetical protein